MLVDSDGRLYVHGATDGEHKKYYDCEDRDVATDCSQNCRRGSCNSTTFMCSTCNTVIRYRLFKITHVPLRGKWVANGDPVKSRMANKLCP